MSKIFTLYRWILYPVIIIYLLIAIAPLIFGIRPYIVLSASMEPTIMTGALGYINTKDCDDVNTGDIVAYTMGGEITVIHRIIEENEDGTYVTKGDNNEDADFVTLHPSQIVGTVVGSIPKLGYITSWLQSKQGIIISVGLVLVGLISSWIDDRSSRKEELPPNPPTYQNYYF